MAQHVKSTQQKCEEETMGAKAAHAQVSPKGTMYPHPFSHFYAFLSFLVCAQLVQLKMQAHEQQLQVDSLESMLLRYRSECDELDGEKQALEQSVKNYTVLVQKQSAEVKDLKYQLLVYENNVEACCEQEKNELRLSAQQLQQDLNDARIRINEHVKEISNLNYIVMKSGGSDQRRTPRDGAKDPECTSTAAKDSGSSTSPAAPHAAATSSTNSSTLFFSPASAATRTGVSPSMEEALRLSALSAQQNDFTNRELLRLERKSEKYAESLRKKK